MRALLASILIVLPQAAQAATPPPAPCLTAEEFSAVSIYALPSMVRGAAQRCNDVLPPRAYLRTNGEQLARRYSQGRERHWPRARQALLKAGSGFDAQAPEMLRAMPDDSLKPLFDDMVIAMVDQQLPQNRCASLDKLVMLLSPLPAPLAAEGIALGTGIAARTDRRRVGPLNICRA